MTTIEPTSKMPFHPRAPIGDDLAYWWGRVGRCMRCWSLEPLYWCWHDGRAGGEWWCGSCSSRFICR